MPGQYASYGRRVGGYLIDLLLVWVPPFFLIAVGIAFLFADSARALGIVLIVTALLWGPVVGIWNYIIKQGRTGQTVGKARVGTKLIREETGQPVGAGYAFLRWFLELVLGSVSGGIFTIVDLIFPAFDSKRQRVLDKMLRTVVVNTGASNGSTVMTTKTESPRSLYS